MHHASNSVQVLHGEGCSLALDTVLVGPFIVALFAKFLLSFLLFLLLLALLLLFLLGVLFLRSSASMRVVTFGDVGPGSGFQLNQKLRLGILSPIV